MSNYLISTKVTMGNNDYQYLTYNLQPDVCMAMRCRMSVDKMSKYTI